MKGISIFCKKFHKNATDVPAVSKPLRGIKGVWRPEQGNAQHFQGRQTVPEQGSRLRGNQKVGMERSPATPGREMTWPSRRPNRRSKPPARHLKRRSAYSPVMCSGGILH